MACRVDRLRGEVLDVRLENGQPSELYKKIVGSPLTKFNTGTTNSSEYALGIYKDMEVRLPQDLMDNYPVSLTEPTGEPTLLYKVGDYYSTSLRSVLNRENVGTVEVGVLYPRAQEVVEVTNPTDVRMPSAPLTIRQTNLGVEGSVISDSNFLPFMTYELDNQNTGNGVIIEAIQNSVVSEQRILEDGEYKFLPQGTDDVSMMANKQAVMSVLQTLDSVTNIRSNGTEAFNYDVYDRHKFHVGDQTMTQEEFAERAKKGDPEVFNDVTLPANLHQMATNQGFNYRPQFFTTDSQTTPSKEELLTKLDKALVSLGISRESIESYKARYRAQTGQDIDVAGFADLANQTIGFVEGDIDSFTEEAAHVLIEAMNGTEAQAAAMEEVVNTPEYEQVKRDYQPLYESMYEGEALEEAYRKEALGKILKRYLTEQQGQQTQTTEQTAEQATQPQGGFLTTVVNAIRRWIDSVRARFAPRLNNQVYSSINRLNEQVADYLFNERYGEQIDNFSTARLTLFNNNNMDSKHKSWFNKVSALKDRLSNISSDSVEFDRISEDMLENDTWRAAIRLSGIAEYEIQRLVEELKGAEAHDQPASQDAIITYINLKQGVIPVLNDMRVLINDMRRDSPLSKTDLRNLEESMQNSISQFSLAEGRNNRLNSQENFERVVLRRLYDVYGWNDQQIEHFRSQIYAERSDLNSIIASIGSIAHRNNPLLSTLVWQVGDVHAKSALDMNTQVLARYDEFLSRNYTRLLDDLVVRNADGTYSEYLTNPIRLAEAIADFTNFKKQTKADLARISEEDLAAIPKDRAAMVVKNILLEILTSSSQSPTLTKTNRGEGTVKLTEEELQTAKERIQPLVNKLNELYGTNLTTDSILVKKQNIGSDNVYNIPKMADTTIQLLFDAELDRDPLRLDNMQKAMYSVALSEYKLENMEQMFEDEYYREELQRVQQNPDMAIAVATLKDINVQTGAIRARHRRTITDRNGVERSVLDMSSLRANPSDSLKLSRLENQLRAMRNPYVLADIGIEGTNEETSSNEYDVEVSLKPGLEEVREGGRTVVRALDLTPDMRDDMTEADLITWGMIKMQEYYQRETPQASQEFIDEVRRIASDTLGGTITEQEARINAYDFLRFNGAIGMNDQFFDEMADHQNYITRVENAINAMDDVLQRNEYSIILDRYKNRYGQLRYYNRINRNVSNVGEVDYSGNEAARREVRKIDEDLKAIRRQLPRLETQTPGTMEKGMNESYMNDLRSEGIESGTEAELKFLEKHVVDERGWRDFDSQIERYRRNRRPMFRNYERYLTAARASGTTDAYLQAKLEYLRDNVASYYVRYTPPGFNQLMTDLRSGSVSPEILLNTETAPPQYAQALQYTQVNPRYDWRESIFNDRNINPRYNPDGEFTQFKAFRRNAETGVLEDLWVDREHFNRFGLDTNDYYAGKRMEAADEANRLTATRDVEAYDALTRYTEIRAINLAQKKKTREISRFRVPRKSRTTLEKFKAFGSNPLSSAKETLRDLVSFRVDETDAPKDASGKTIVQLGEIRTIPMYYETELEDPSTQSHDWLGILAEDSAQAFLYKNRVEAESQILATLNQIGMQNFTDDVEAANSLTIKRAKEYVDAMIYNRTVNANIDFKIGGRVIRLSKFLKSFNSIFAHTNLAFNPMVDLTGATTAGVTRFLMHKAGEYFARSSMNFANKEAPKLAAQLLKESGNVLKTSTLIRMYETLGLFDPNNRINNTQFSKAMRMVSKSPYGGASLSNLTNTAPLVITVLKDHRLFNGRFVNYNEFSRLAENARQEGQSNREWKTQLDARWQEIFDQSAYDLLQFEYGIRPKQGVELNLQGQTLDDLHTSLYNKISNMVEMTDGVISKENRTWLQRHPLLRLLMTHKGWFAIALDRRFKGRQINLRSNQEEVGHYNGVVQLIMQAYDEAGSFNPIKIKAKMKEIVEREGSLSPEVVASKYVAMESAFTIMMTILGVAVLSASESDDNEDIWAIQFGALLYLRTLSELNSISILGLGGSTIDTFQKPFVAADYLGNLTDLEDWSFEEVQSGKYEGIPKIWAKLSKLTLGKRFFDVYHMRETNRIYRKFNGGTLPFLKENGLAEEVIIENLLDR